MAKKYFSGFTLVELLIVITIVIVIAAIAIALSTGQIFKGNDAKRKGDLDRIKIAIEEYEKDHDCYPQYVTCGVKTDQPVYPYLKNVPCDPVTHASYSYETDGSTTCAKWFRLYTTLQNLKDLSVTSNIGPTGAYNYYVSSDNAPKIGANSGYYGCFSGTCLPINWNSSLNRPECGPNFQNSACYGQCMRDGTPVNECIYVN